MIGLQQMVGWAQLPFVALTQGVAQARLSAWSWMLPAIDHLEPTLQAEADSDLRRRSMSLRYRAKSGESLDAILPEAFALVREAARRALGMRHYHVQLLGGIALHYRSIAEMQTGEGKTLTASSPLYLNALTGRGVQLATANDYLARRDAEQMQPMFKLLGMSIGVIEAQQPNPKRREAYQCDITYGTAKEFGFDFLRDQLLLRRIREGHFDLIGRMVSGGGLAGDQPVQREPHFMLVDEADSLLIDEARTPLIISALPGEAQKVAEAAFRWAAAMVKKFEENVHYVYDHKKKAAELTIDGRRQARTLEKPQLMVSVPVQNIYEYIERAIRAVRDFHHDQQYVVRDGEIVIVDEFTGRLGEGRKWRDGLHQAIEAKENVKVTVDSGQAARVTVQDYFLRFEKMAGMTGTGSTSVAEFRKVYQLGVCVIPTHRPCIRQRLPERIYGTEAEKWQAIVGEIRELHAIGRPLLIGTRSIEKSELLAELLKKEGLPHQILNARQVKQEAEIVSKAGVQGQIMVSTNMAGRGTDIRLGPGVAELGGLHVICTEMHDSPRVDRQLIGRCARQGDPGSYRVYASLDDELLLQALGPHRAKRLLELGKTLKGNVAGQYYKLFMTCQRRAEARHFRDRKVLMYYERERKKMQIQMGQDPYLDTPY